VPTTSYTNSTFSVNVVGSRTDSAGVSVSDFSAEEARFPAEILTEGYLKPATAFKVQPQAVPNMSVKVGSATAKADFYVVAGDVQGQGNYIVRLDVTSQNVTIDASDASQARTDEIYLVVRDNAYDVSSRVLPQIGYRKGDLGGANPGPDTQWEAWVLLARVAVGAAATTITSANITDVRIASALQGGLATTDHGTLSGLADDDHTQYHNDTRGDARYIRPTIVDAKGDLIAGTAADTIARVGIGSNGQVLSVDSTQTAGVRWSSVFASAVVTLTDGATVALDASLGEYFRLSASGDRTLAAPTNPKDGQGITIEHLASGAARTLALNVGTGGFLLGTTITALTQTELGKRDFIRAIYNSTLNKWLVVGYSKGF
jgi:hypothetical protein